MKKGRIIKSMSSFFYVQLEEDQQEYECKARGLFKKKGISPLIGDYVNISIIDPEDKKGVIEEVYPRTNFLIRPPIANVTKALLVFGIKNPEPNLSLIDRFVVLAEKQRLDIVICFNKVDLDDENEHHRLVRIYKDAGYKVIISSAVKGEHIEEIRKELHHNINVVAGPSGVGKSSLLNAIDPRLQLKVSEVSAKLGRGRHTTRYARLIDVGQEGLVADTPGFSSLSIDTLEDFELKEYFIEFHEYDHDCKFGFKCFHEKEPGCMVRKAAEENQISKERYTSYLQLLGEVREAKRNRY